MGISIHLMLRFIMEERLMSILNSHFNTSHVKVYPVFEHLQFLLHFISIHLMLRFIEHRLFLAVQNLRISIHLMLRFIGLWRFWFFEQFYFNTSHVKVYPTPCLGYDAVGQFQYISC